MALIPLTHPCPRPGCPQNPVYLRYYRTMNGPYIIGTWIGFFLASMLVPAILLFILKLIPATKNMHRFNYGLTGAIGTLSPLTTISSPYTKDTLDLSLALSASAALALVFFFAYRRAKRSDDAQSQEEDA